MSDSVDREPVDGDLLYQVVLNACPSWMSDAAARDLAVGVLAGCVRTGYFVVLRGPDRVPWTPSSAL